MHPPCHFLIVEDNRYDLELACAWLERRFPRCQFTCVATPSEAREVFVPRKFSAALVNLCLQHNRIAGIPLIAEFRRQQLDLPILVVSGHDDERMRRMALGAGADAFLSKDSDGTEGQIVYNLLQRHMATLERGGCSVAKSWRTTMWGSVAALGTAMFGAPTALILAKATVPELAEIVNALPPRLLGYTLLVGVVLAPFGIQMMGKAGRDQKEAERFWTEHRKTCPGHHGPGETETKT